MILAVFMIMMIGLSFAYLLDDRPDLELTQQCRAEIGMERNSAIVVDISARSNRNLWADIEP